MEMKLHEQRYAGVMLKFLFCSFRNFNLILRNISINLDKFGIFEGFWTRV